MVARVATVWGEFVEAGAAFLVGTTSAGIRAGYRRASKVKASAFRATRRIFGGGNASENVAKVVSKFLSARGKVPVED